MKKPTILVTGGTGYIGSHTVVELLNKGYEVVVVDNLSNSREEIIHAIQTITGTRPPFYKVDLRSKEETSRFFNSVKVDAVVHFAAFKSVGESVKKPLDYYENNVGGLVHLLDQAILHNISSFVFSSSCTVYGNPDKLPVDETSPVKKPVSPYGNTKKICEEILQDVCSGKKMRAISLRYFNPIGAHESALIGEFQTAIPNNLLPALTETAIGKRKHFEVYGNDYNTPDGTCIRDYIHVLDVAAAHVSAIERLLSAKSKNPYEYFNIGTGRGNSVLEVIKEFENVSGKKLNYKIAPRRPGDAEQIFADVSLAARELNWKAERTLSDMLRSAWKWEQKLATVTTK
jgi:UDP-glucose 4-epimerase